MQDFTISETVKKVSLIQRILNQLVSMLRTPETEDGDYLSYSPLFLMLVPMILGIQAMVTEVEEMLSSVLDRDAQRAAELSDAYYERNVARQDVARLTKEVQILRDKLYPPPGNLTERVKFMATGVLGGASYKINAIKQCREDLNVGLADAKNMVEAFMASLDFRHYKSRVENYVKGLRDDNSERQLDIWETANRWHSDLADLFEISDRVKFVACGAGSVGSAKIHAIKVAREEKGLGLADAKNAVERFLESKEFSDYHKRAHEWLAGQPRPKHDQVEAYATEWQRFLRAPKEDTNGNQIN